MLNTNSLHAGLQVVITTLLFSLLIQGSLGQARSSSGVNRNVHHQHRTIYERGNNSVLPDLAPSERPALVTRTDLWGDSVRVGGRLNALMRNGRDPTSQQSKWIDYAEIEQYGWRIAPGSNRPNDDEITSAQPVLDFLHIPSLEDKSWHVKQWEHSQDSKIQGKEYPATGAEFRALYNPRYKIVIATSNTSPAHSESRIPDTDLVPLRHWSDITYLTWTDLCNKANIRPDSLKYIVRLNIINIEANEILAQIAGTSMEKYNKPFPGDKIETPQSANAVVGFPLGRSIAMLLIQHKQAFGRTRSIKEVRFWDSYNGEKKPTLLGLEAIPNMIYILS